MKTYVRTDWIARNEYTKPILESPVYRNSGIIKAVTDENEKIHIKEDENSGVMWIPINKILESSSEIWVRDRVYAKIIDKMRKDEIIKNI